MTRPVAKAHRLLAPRIAYLIGTRDHVGTPNSIPVSNVTSVSTDPQHVLLAVHKKWRTYETLLTVAGFTVSVPLMSQLEGVWKLAARYSHYPATSPREKLTAAGLSLDYDISAYGPVLIDGIGWMDCRTINEPTSAVITGSSSGRHSASGSTRNSSTPKEYRIRRPAR